MVIGCGGVLYGVVVVVVMGADGMVGLCYSMLVIMSGDGVWHLFGVQCDGGSGRWWWCVVM